MKKIVCAALMSTMAVVAFADEDTKVQERVYKLPKCSSPAASIVIGKLTCKASGCQNGPSAGADNPILRMLSAAGQPNISGIGDGLGDMLTTALKQTGCFEIQEREAMDELAKELALVGKKVEAKQADFMISGSINSLGMDQKRSSLGFGLIPVIGSIGSTTSKAYLGLDLRLIDVNKASILESKTFDANNEKSSWGVGAGGMVGIGFGGGAFSSLKGTAMEEVARDAIIQATIFITERLAKDKITERVDLAAKKEETKQSN